MADYREEDMGAQKCNGEQMSELQCMILRTTCHQNFTTYHLSGLLPLRLALFLKSLPLAVDKTAASF